MDYRFLNNICYTLDQICLLRVTRLCRLSMNFCLSHTGQLFFYYFQVTCTGHFTQKFPVSELRHDVEVLIIEPYNACPNQVGICVQQENELTLGPTYQMLRLLKGIY